MNILSNASWLGNVQPIKAQATAGRRCAPQKGTSSLRGIAVHVSRQMLKHYSHIEMEAKRRAVQSLAPKENAAKTDPGSAKVEATSMQILKDVAKESTKVEQIN